MRSACKECVKSPEFREKRAKRLLIPKGFKICSDCKKEKHISTFYKDKKAFDLKRADCISCYKFNRKRSLNIIEFNDLFKKQKGRCLICNSKGKLVVDHCHKTNVVRGLLCLMCNHGLGRFKDNIVFLQNAINYLKNNKTQYKYFKNLTNLL